MGTGSALDAVPVSIPAYGRYLVPILLNMGHCGSGHAFALVRAVVTGVRTLLAMVVLVLFALHRASLTNLRANTTELGGKGRTPTHEGGRRPAHLGAVVIEGNALGQHGQLRFLQAGARTVLAGLRAAHTGFNTRTVGLISHDIPPWAVGSIRQPS